MKVKICPRCGSINVGVQSALHEVHNYCEDCGYGDMKNEQGMFMNMIFPEIDKKDVIKFKKHLKGIKQKG